MRGDDVAGVSCVTRQDDHVDRGAAVVSALRERRAGAVVHETVFPSAREVPDSPRVPDVRRRVFRVLLSARFSHGQRRGEQCLPTGVSTHAEGRTGAAAAGAAARVGRRQGFAFARAPERDPAWPRGPGSPGRASRRGQAEAAGANFRGSNTFDL